MDKRAELIPNTLNGDLRRGGYRVSGQVAGDTDAIQRGENIQARGRSLCGFVDPDERIYFDGHVLANMDYQFSRHASLASWTVGTVDNLLAGESVQDISFAVAASPANSHEAASWDFGEIITHILEDHCNFIYDPTGANGSPDGVVASTDIDTTNSFTMSNAGEYYIVNQSNNLWRTLQQIAGGEEGGGEFYRIWVTRKNVIKYQPAPPFISPQPAAKGTLDEDCIRGTVRVTLHNSDPGERVGQVQIMAVANSTTVYTASYPSDPADGKLFKKESGIWAQSQARTDTLAERLYRWLTRSYTLQVEVDAGLVLFGDDGEGLDLGDRLLLTYDGPAADAVTGAGVHLDIASQSFFVYGVDVRFDTARRRAVATLTLEHDNSS